MLRHLLKQFLEGPKEARNIHQENLNPGGLQPVSIATGVKGRDGTTWGMRGREGAVRCDGRPPARSRRVSPCAGGMDALPAPVGGDAFHVGERRPPGSTATPCPSVMLVKGTNTPFCHHHCAHAVGFVSIAGVNIFWFFVILI